MCFARWLVVCTVVFLPSATGCRDDGDRTRKDVTPPTLAYCEPWHGQTHVPLDAPIFLDFSERLDEDTVTFSTVRLRDMTRDQDVPVSVWHGRYKWYWYRPKEHPRATGYRTSIMPSVPLMEDTDYEIRVDSTLTDRAGNPLRPFPPIPFRTGRLEPIPPPDPTCSDWGRVVRCGDVDGDGFDDLVSTQGTDIHILHGPDLQRRVTTSDPFLSPHNGVFRLGDLNGDGMADIVSQCYTDSPMDLWITAYFGPDLASRIEVRTLIPGNTRFGHPITLGDVDGDGIADLVTGDGQLDSLTLAVFHGPDLSRTTVIPRPSDLRDDTWMRSPKVADLDGDGWPDIVYGTGYEAHSLVVHRGPDFLAYDWVMRSTLGKVAAVGVMVALGDATGDGRPDILTTAPRVDWDRDCLLLVDGPTLRPLRFIQLPWPERRTYETYGALDWVDFYGDGQPDIYLSNTGGGVRCLLGPYFHRSLEFWCPGGNPCNANFGESMAAGDIEGDGVPEILIGGHRSYCDTTEDPPIWLAE